MNSIANLMVMIPERLVEVLRAKLPDAITAIADAGMRLDTPDDGHYYLPGKATPRTLFNAPVVVTVDQIGAMTPIAEQSGDNSTRPVVVSARYRIRIAFNAGAYNALDRIGHDQTEPEHYTHAANRYAGALLEVIEQYAADSSTITQVRWLGSVADALDVQDFGLRGLCESTWEIQAEGTIPQDIRKSGGTPV